MNDITKDKIKNFIHKFGVHIMKSKYHRTSYSSQNFKMAPENATIFDIGANIGQSTLQFKRSYPKSTIYSFEPVHSVYETLVSNLARYEKIHTFNIGLGGEKKYVDIPKVYSSTSQITQVLGEFKDHGGETERIEIFTIDEFCSNHSIDHIDILKTDTEGFDLEVCKGSEFLLKNKKVSYIVSEVSIAPGDYQHTDFFELMSYLRPFGYRVIGFTELCYPPNMPLEYFNAIFERNT